MSLLSLKLESLFGRAPATAAGCLQDENVAGVDVDGTFPAEINQPGVVAPKQIEAARSGLASSKAVGPQRAAVRQDGQFQRLPENRFSDDPVSTEKLAPAAAAARQGEALEVDGIPALQDFGIGQTGVGHVDVNPGLTVPGRASS